jgi:predicted RNase H-like HicB family nuclease
MVSSPRRFPMSHAEQILRAAAALVARGKREFSRKEVRDEIGLSHADWQSGYMAIFQGMRDDEPGGAPSVGKRFRNVFHRVERGRYVLTKVGEDRVRELQESQGAGSHPRRGKSPTSMPLRGKAGLRQVVIYPGEDGYWVAECPSLPGCLSQGQTKQDAIRNIREAIQAYVAALVYDDLPVPEERFQTLLIAV